MPFTAEQAMHLKRQKIGFSITDVRAKTYIFLHFINPVTIFSDGKKTQTFPNSCIIFTPGSNLHYSAEKIGMLHNFFHFNIESDDYFRRYGIPLNRIFCTGLQDEITDTVEFIETCMVKKFENSVGLIDRAADRLFTLLSDELAGYNKVNGYSRRSRFDELRSEIYRTPAEFNTEKMAKFMNMSRSDFSVKYREIFGRTPSRDLSDAAMLYANKLLESDNGIDCCNIADIAFMCGFTSPDYFIRAYKKYYGTTPGSYRKLCRNRRLADNMKGDG